jgi:hypothetical protein
MNGMHGKFANVRQETVEVLQLLRAHRAFPRETIRAFRSRTSSHVLGALLHFFYFYKSGIHIGILSKNQRILIENGSEH